MLTEKEKTDFSALLNKPLSRSYIMMLVKLCTERPEMIAQALEITADLNSREAMMASWLLSHLADEQPQMLQPFRSQLIRLARATTSGSIRRNLLRIIAFYPIPTELQGVLFDDCLRWMASEQQPIAVRANAMQILWLISQNEPELADEVMQHILMLMDEGSAGFRSRGKNIIARLRKLKTD